jgi:hypothetical protein
LESLDAADASRPSHTRSIAAISINRKDDIGLIDEKKPSRSELREGGTSMRRFLDAKAARAAQVRRRRPSARSLRPEISSILRDTLRATGIPVTHALVELDESDESRQSLLVRYPSILKPGENNVRSAVKIEAGAKSALDPHQEATVLPYIARKLPDFDFRIQGVTTVHPGRTFWDKIVILHGLGCWFERRGECATDAKVLTGHRLGQFDMWVCA